VPISPKGIRGPAGARKENNHDVEPSKKSPANFGLNRESSGLNCPFGASRTRAHALYNVHPFGVHIWVPFRAPIRAGSPKGGRATKEKKNKSRPIMGTPLGCPYACPMGACINGVGALPTPYGPTLRGAHNGPSGLQK